MEADRIYLQYAPVEVVRQRLVLLQDKLVRSAGGKSMPAQELYMTLLHIGVLEELWGEMRRLNTSLTLDDVRNKMCSYAEEAYGLMPQAVRVRPSGLEMFGPRHDVLVLRIMLDMHLSKLHRHCLDLLIRNLYELFNDDPREFMRNSPNLRYSLEARPHITLLRHATDGQLDKFTMTEPLRMTAVPPLENLKQGA
jgi:hypothetical protein